MTDAGIHVEMGVKRGVSTKVVVVGMLMVAAWLGVGAGMAYGDVALTIGSVNGYPGGQVTVPVTVDVGTELPAAFDLDVLFDTAKLQVVGVQAGQAALAAQKSVSFFTTAEKVGIVVFGSNTLSIGNGVLANITFAVRSQVNPGDVVALTGANASAADGATPFPNPINVVVTNGQVAVGDVPVPSANMWGLVALVVLFGIGGLLPLRRLVRA